MPAVIDCFMLNNELDLLEFRLNWLGPVVDHFVIVEGDRTHAGDPKQSAFKAAGERFAAWSGKISHRLVELDPSATDPWRREQQQRTGMHQGLLDLDLAPEDLILVSDLDEVPYREVVEQLPGTIRVPTRLTMHYATYYANWLRPDLWWNSTMALHRRDLGRPIMLERFGIRPGWDIAGYREPQLLDCGWHLSFLGGEAAIRDKLASYTHQEVNRTELRAGPHLSRCLELGVHVEGRYLLRKLRRSELDPLLSALHEAQPELFRFEEPAPALRRRAYRAFAWARHRGFLPTAWGEWLDRHPGAVTGAGAPALAAVDAALALRRRVRPDRRELWCNPIRYRLHEHPSALDQLR